MESISRLLLYGNDKRQLALGKLFEQNNIPVTYCNRQDEIPDLTVCQVSPAGFAILLPVPCSDSLYQQVLETVQRGTIVLGGNVSEEFIHQCSIQGAKVYDYLKSPSVVIHNTIATAEGAICEAIKHSPWNLHGSACLVMGYGRCGSVLADRLKGLGCRITVSARNLIKIAQAETCGYAILKPETELGQFRFLFNTIPAPIVDANMLSALSREITIIDIASSPGGCDFKYCEEHDIPAYLCPGLPAKYAPDSSAEIIFRHIHEVFQFGSKGKKL